MTDSASPALGATLHLGAGGGGLPADPILRARLAAVLRLWRSGITEKNNPPFVLGCIRQGLGWSWVDKIDGFEWCGALAAEVDRVALGMDAQHRRRFYASTFRLVREVPPDRHPDFRAVPVLTAGRQPVPGELIIVGTPDGKPWGQHITIVVAAGAGADHVTPAAVKCIGGNQYGQTGRGSGLFKEAVALTGYPGTLTAKAPMWIIETPAELCAHVQPVTDAELIRLLSEAGLWSPVVDRCPTCGQVKP